MSNQRRMLEEQGNITMLPASLEPRVWSFLLANQDYIIYFHSDMLKTQHLYFEKKNSHLYLGEVTDPYTLRDSGCLQQPHAIAKPSEEDVALGRPSTTTKLM